MVTTRGIDAAEVGRILALEEGHFLDVKRVEIKPSKLSESISAFANTAGGELFIGIGEGTSQDRKTRFWNGFTNAEAANGLFAVIEGLTPLGGHYSASFLSTMDQPGLVLHLVVSKTRAVLHATDGHPYIRRNAQNLRVDSKDGLDRLKLDKGIISFEDETVPVDPALITNSVVSLKFIDSVVPSAEPEEWMRKQSLLVEGKPIVAGLLLFSEEPQAALPKRSAIKLYRYKTKADEGSREQLAFDPLTIEGCLYDQVYTAVNKTKELVEGLKILTNKGLESVSYPHETLHEIITNAVLHRDYSIAADVHVRIFDNRIEVESPGRLPGHVTKENILKEQSARNPKLVRLINKFPNPPNKDVGEGLNTAFEAMKKLRLREPEVVENDYSVVVHIRHTPLATPQEAVMNYLNDHDEIKNSVGRELTGIQSENSMKDVFLSLKKAKLIEPVPGKRGNAFAWRKYTGHWEQQTEEAEPEETSTQAPPANNNEGAGDK